MGRRCAIALGLLSLLAADSQAATMGSDGVMVLDGLWLIHSGDDPSFAYPDLDDFGWQQQHVPTTPSMASVDWQGYGWYRLHLLLGADATEEKMMLSLGPAREVLEVFINGKWLAGRGGFGSRLNGAEKLSPFLAHIPPGTLLEGDNVIAVRIYDPSPRGGLAVGPLILGTPKSTLNRLGIPWGKSLRQILGSFALFIALTQLLLLVRGDREPASMWSAASGLLLGLLLLDGTGIFRAILAVDLSARSTMVLAPVTILCLGSFVVSRYDDFGSPQVTYMRAGLICLAVLTLLLPNGLVYAVTPPVVVVLGLATCLYGIHLCVRAVRRGDADALPMLIAVCTLTVLFVYDGWSGPTGDVWPPASAVGGVAVLGLATALSTGRMLQENHSMLRRLALGETESGESHRGLLAAAAMRVTNPDAYLHAAIQELARELGVRRCSLVLKDHRGDLRVRAAIGLPNHLKNVKIEAQSIAAHVFASGDSLRPENLPAELRTKRRGSHTTTVFRATPVMGDGQTLGVLNISDRNDGGDFDIGDELALAENAQRLGIILAQLPLNRSEAAPQLDPAGFDPPGSRLGPAAPAAPDKPSTTLTSKTEPKPRLKSDPKPALASPAAASAAHPGEGRRHGAPSAPLAAAAAPQIGALKPIENNQRAVTEPAVRTERHATIPSIPLPPPPSAEPNKPEAFSLAQLDAELEGLLGDSKKAK